MAETMQFDLVSPERLLATFAASEVLIPGDEGDMVAMPDHAPTITTLRPGLVRAIGGGQTQEFLVTGGFAEIVADAASVLAEHAMPRAEVTQEIVSELMTSARKEAAEATDQRETDLLNKRVADLEAVVRELGLTA